MEISFIHPAFLLLALVAPVLWFVPRRLRDRGHGVLRSAVVVLVALALARPVTYGEEGETHFVFVHDASASVVDQGLARDALRRLAAAAPAGARTTGVRFGTRAQRGAASPFDRTIHLTDATGVSPLGAALAAADAAIPAGAAGSVTLVSDGLATDRRWGPVVQGFVERGIPVHTIALPHEASARLVAFEALDTLRVGRTARMRVDIVGGPAVVDVTLVGPDGPLAAVPDVRCTGRTSTELRFEPEDAGYLGLAVTVEAKEGRVRGPRLQRTFAVQDPLRVLYLGGRMSGGAEHVAALLGPGFTVETADLGGDAPEPALDAFDLVVLDDRPAEVVPEAFQRRLVQRVAATGLGLLVAGGRSAFGSGGYHESPIADVLPVEFLHKEEKRDPSTTLVVIIDTSGSMGGNRVQLAKEVARLAIRRLLPHDKVGIVEFYGAKRWAAPIQPASNAIEIERALNRLNAGGGTIILPAIEEAFYGLQNVQTRYKHVLVLTDGGVEMGAFEPLLRKMADKGITASTVLVGADLHSEFLVNLANWGKGRFYSVPNRFNLPEVLLKQPASARLPDYKPGTHALNARGGRGWWGEVDPTAVPPVSGYVEVGGRPGAETLLETVEGAHPVLATWRYGLGRVTAFMTEPVGPGTRGWTDWDAYGAFLGRVFARTATDLAEPFAFRLERHDHELRLEAQRLVVAPLEPTARLFAPRGDAPLAIPFRERADGLFTARVPWPPDREARVEAGVEGDSAGAVVRLVSSAREDVTPEWNVDPARALDLARLAEATGGRHAAADDVEGLSLNVGGGDAPVALRALWPFALLLALLAYLGELFHRRRARRRGAS